MPLKSALRNAVFDFSEMTTSVVAVITDVMRVTELNRLLLFQIPAGKIRRSGDLRVDVKCRPRKNNA